MPYLRLYSGTLSVEIAPFIEEIKWSENDLDSPNAGRTLDGKMQRGKITDKRKAEIKLLPVSASVANSILKVLRKQYFYCDTDLVPSDEGQLIMEMYNSTRSGGILIVTTDGVIKHRDVSFNIIER